MSKFYPPIIEGKLPAFTVNNGSGSIIVPFQINRAVGKDDFGNTMTLLIKTVSTNITKATLRASTSTKVAVLNETTNNYETTFDFTTTNFQPEVGQYYKLQLAYGSGTTLGYYSTVGIAKCTASPAITIEGLNGSGVNNSKTTYVGQYQNSEVAEKVYSYRFIIKDSIDEIYDDSGWLLHNSNTDSSSTTSSDTWSPSKTLLQDEQYTIQYKVQTLNNLMAESSVYNISEAITVIPPSFYGELSAVLDKENGCIELFMVQKSTSKISGKFVLWRTSNKENFEMWQELIRCDMASNETMSIWRDFTIEQGVEYLYAFSIYNDAGVHSTKIYNIENRILADFEHMYLTDGERQLKIAFNPKVSSFKTTMLETKTDTIGSQFPFFFRNGNVKYKEFPISGLLSLLSDENNLFTSLNSNFASYRIETPVREEPAAYGLEIKNFANERNFKLEALDWLTNGKPKLFRSPGEGNYIVRLMNVSLSPNDQLGRMLHTFSSTAYEIAPFNLQSFKDCGLRMHEGDVINYKKKKVSMQLSSPKSPVSVDLTSNTVTIASPYAQKIKLTNCLPTTTITVNYYSTGSSTVTVGASGQCLLQHESKKIKSLQFSSVAALSMTTLECEYEHSYNTDLLRNTSNVQIQIMEEYEVGHTSSTSNPKQYWTTGSTTSQKGRCFYLKVRKRPIYYIDIKKQSLNVYNYYYTGTTEPVDWEVGSFYIAVINEYNNVKNFVIDGSKAPTGTNRPTASSLNYTFAIKGNCAPIDLTYEFTQGLINEKTFVNIGEPTSLLMGNALVFDSIYEIKTWG